MKTCIAVLFGCASVEHEISIISAVQAMHNIDREKYDILPIYVTKSREMFTGEQLMDISAFSDIPALIKQCRRIYLVRENGKVLMKYSQKKAFEKDAGIAVDIAFPIVHGTNCEDGTVAGYLEMLGLPYISCGCLAAAVGMDKAVFKYVLHAAGLPVLPCVTFTARSYAADPNAIIEKIESKIGYPMIIKPVNLGSSVGISKVENRDELKSATTLACSFAAEILAERAITSLREINCSVVGEGEDCEASLLEEPFMKDKILSYDDKYRSNSTGAKGMASLSRQCPADLSAKKTEEIRAIAKRVFAAIKASGVVRIDFLIDTKDNDTVYVNEINTIPGSLAFYLWEPAGVSYTQLIDRLVEIAFKRQRSREQLMFTIDTNILSEKGLKLGGKGGKL